MCKSFVNAWELKDGRSRSARRKGMRKKTGGRDDAEVLTGTNEDGEDQEQQRDRTGWVQY